MNIEKHLELLGYKVKDKMSDYEGAVTSISFDLYGCIQANVTPIKLSDDGSFKSGHWLDVVRLEILSDGPLMVQPDFGSIKLASGQKGPDCLPSK